MYESLLSKARTSPECRTEVVQALVRAMEQASNTTNLNEKFFLWEGGAGLLADLKATKALDLLIANIDFTGGWSASLSQYHFPALAAVLKSDRRPSRSSKAFLETTPSHTEESLQLSASPTLAAVKLKRCYQVLYPAKLIHVLKDFCNSLYRPSTIRQTQISCR